MMGLLVIDPGLSSTVQDMGRPGYREWGVPPAGAYDRCSAGLANALLGNSIECALLELTLRGGVYRATVPLALALSGAPISAKVVQPDGAETSVMVPQSFSMKVNDRLELGQGPEGARSYLAVRGGWRVARVLGSASSETPIRAGDRLEAEPGRVASRRPAQSFWLDPTSHPIRVIDDPDARSLQDHGPEFWRERNFRVSARSNRMGLRLEGEPIDATLMSERLSTPVCPGSIQLAGGQLIVLGVACGTMGGYPLIAHVISADLDRLAQLRPGALIRFERVTLDEARIRDQESRQLLSRTFARISIATEQVSGEDEPSRITVKVTDFIE